MRYVYSAVQKYIEFLGNRKKSMGQVLMFHHIRTADEQIVEKNITISASNFETVIKKIVDSDAIVYSIDSIKKCTSPKCIIITFDDAFESVYTIAYPILKKYNVPFCVFITKNYIGKKNYLNEKEIKELVKEEICTIGGHTSSHQVLRYLSKEHAQREICDSKQELEQILKIKVNYFAFPYGSLYAVGNRELRFAKEAGYKCIFTTLRMPISSIMLKTKVYSRINVNDDNFIQVVSD